VQVLGQLDHDFLDFSRLEPYPVENFAAVGSNCRRSNFGLWYKARPMREGKTVRVILVSAALMALFILTPAGNSSAGSISGEVTFNDDLPSLAAVKVSKDQDYCGENLPNETYLIDPNGGLSNVVVFLETAPAGKPADPQRENLLGNTGCSYSPRILAMQKGERLKVRNNDPKLHIPHSYLDQRTVFNLSLPFRGTSIDATKKIRRAGIMKVVCDTHAWMLAYIHVFDHPFFAVTDERGAFTIPSVPPGTYILKAWHEDAGTRSQEITVTDSGDIRVGFEFTKKPQPQREGFENISRDPM
jgi:Polysaccharide lyase family 4, domain II